MRTPHRITAQTPAQPYEELSRLDELEEDGPPEQFLHDSNTQENTANDGPVNGRPANDGTVNGGTVNGGPASDGTVNGGTVNGGPASDWTVNGGTVNGGPANHRRGRRRKRFAGLPFARKAVVGLLVLTAFLTLADRWAVFYAEHRAAGQLKDSLKLSAVPEVEIGGFPFLTQFASGRLDEVKVTVHRPIG